MQKPSFTTDLDFARSLDGSDRLADFRERFYRPAGQIYVNGNSLGLMSKDAERCVQRVIDEWKQLGGRGWMDAREPWVRYGERLGAAFAPLIGAEADEVVCTGTTTVNLHALVATFYQPDSKRTKILTDDVTFPTDIYALGGQVRIKGLDAAKELVFVPVDGDGYLDETSIIKMMTDDVALIVLSSVLYRTGQLLDVERVTKQARRRGIVIGWDCSHSMGAIPHAFDRWGVDFAFWSTYKYMNGGPGCPAFLFVNRRHFEREPVLAGWWGYAKEKQFELRTDFQHNRDAGGWQISTPGILSMAPIEGALSIIVEAGIDALRDKSLSMTSYLMYLADERLAEKGFSVGTPREDTRRGGHVALDHNERGRQIFDALIGRGIIGDFRPPNTIRITPSPLYNTYEEMWRVVQAADEIAGG